MALVNALRVEPDSARPRGGVPATMARRTGRLADQRPQDLFDRRPILKWYSVWARTEERSLASAGSSFPPGPARASSRPGIISGMRASGSHDVVFDDVLIPLDHEFDVRAPDGWRAPIDPGRCARDLRCRDLRRRRPRRARLAGAFLEEPQAVQSRRFARDACRACRRPSAASRRSCRQSRLIDSAAADYDEGGMLGAAEANIVKLTVTNNAVEAVEEALSLTGNHGLSRTNPLERH